MSDLQQPLVTDRVELDTKARDRLVTRIADMIARETYNRAPVNYGIAEKAIAMTERALRDKRNWVELDTEEHVRPVITEVWDD